MCHTDATKLTPEFIKHKHQLTQQTGARFALLHFYREPRPCHKPRRFSCPVPGLSIPVMVVIGEQAPPKSKAEMEALAELPGVQVKLFPVLWGCMRMRLRSQKWFCLF